MNESAEIMISDTTGCGQVVLFVSIYYYDYCDMWPFRDKSAVFRTDDERLAEVRHFATTSFNLF